MYDDDVDISEGLASGGTLGEARWAEIDYIVDRYAFEPGKIWVGRNPHNFNDAIGYRDDKHVLVTAGSGSGKGRSFIIPNMAVWPGSIAAYDPKGELPQILAARRADGDEYCDGMGQDVFVLDPLGKTGLGREYLAYFDPLEGLDPDDENLPAWAKRIARSLIMINEGTESGEWAKRAIRMTGLLIRHVLTGPEFEPHERTLITVLRLLMEGHQRILEEIKRQVAKLPPEDRPETLPDPTKLLLMEMERNPHDRGNIAAGARDLIEQSKNTPKFFQSVRGEAVDQLEWMLSGGIEKSLCAKTDDNGDLLYKKFDPRRLKTDPNGVSVFIVMPTDNLKDFKPWLQSVFLGILAAMRTVDGKCASGHQTLFVLDEFLSLGHQDYISTALDDIRGAGTKLMIVVQNFGKLVKDYKEGFESFQTNVGLEVFFGKIGDTAGDYLKKNCGETEIVRVAVSRNRSQNESESLSTAEAHGETESKGGSETSGQSTSLAKQSGWSETYSNTSGENDTVSWSDTVNWGDSRSWGESRGKGMGRNYGPHIFFQPWAGGSNNSTSLNRNRGGGITKGGSKVRGGQRGKSLSRTRADGRSGGLTRTQTSNFSSTHSWQTSKSFTRTETRGRTKGYQIGEGYAQSFHKKPLLDHREINAYLRDIHEDDRDHPAYPGLAVARFASEENPILARRSNYDQDPYFERCFSSDPTHGYTPLEKQRPIGYQFTPEHVVNFRLPEKLKEWAFEAMPLLRRFTWFEENDPIFEFNSRSSDTAINAHAPVSGRVLEALAPEEVGEDGCFMTVRFDRALTDEEKRDWINSVFGAQLKLIEDHESAQKAIEDAAQAERDRLAAEARKAEEERKAQEARERAARLKVLEEKKAEYGNAYKWIWIWSFGFAFFVFTGEGFLGSVEYTDYPAWKFFGRCVAMGFTLSICFGFFYGVIARLRDDTLDGNDQYGAWLDGVERAIKKFGNDWIAAGFISVVLLLGSWASYEGKRTASLEEANKSHVSDGYIDLDLDIN